MRPTKQIFAKNTVQWWRYNVDVCAFFLGNSQFTARWRQHHGDVLVHDHRRKGGRYAFGMMRSVSSSEVWEVVVFMWEMWIRPAFFFSFYSECECLRHRMSILIVSHWVLEKRKIIEKKLCMDVLCGVILTIFERSFQMLAGFVAFNLLRLPMLAQCLFLCMPPLCIVARMRSANVDT